MSDTSPHVTPPVTLPARLAWLQSTIRTTIRPYHFFMAAVIALITGGFVVAIALMLMVAANFNILAWME